MPEGSDLTEVRWKLHRYLETQGSLVPPLRDTELTAVFGEDETLVGSAGCNRYRTSYQVAGRTLAIDSRIATTQMYCGEPEGRMAQETSFLKAWGRVAAYRVDGNRLTLTDAQGTSVLVFTAPDAKEAARED